MTEDELFREWLSYHLDKAFESNALEMSKVAATFSRAGNLQSSGYVFATLKSIKDNFLTAIDTVLFECSRKASESSLSQASVREIMEEELGKHLARTDQSIAAVGGASADAKRTVASQPSLKSILDFALRHYDAGHLRPGSKGHPLTMTNNVIHFHETATSVAIQQASPNAKLEQNNDVSSVTNALKAIDDALLRDLVSLPEDTRRIIEANVGTMRIQLSAPQPSRPILSHAAQTLRSLTEGAVAGTLSEPLLKALNTIGRLFGL